MREATAVLARRMLRERLKASLATLDGTSGSPYVSMVSIADDVDGSPILLLSDLALHTANIRADARAALLLDSTDAAGDPGTGHRLTLTGRLLKTDEPAIRQRYLTRLPSAAVYADFGDFAFWRMAISHGHFIGGFGRIQPLTRTDLIEANGAAGTA